MIVIHFMFHLEFPIIWSGRNGSARVLTEGRGCEFDRKTCGWSQITKDPDHVWGARFRRTSRDMPTVCYHCLNLSI